MFLLHVEDFKKDASYCSNIVLKVHNVGQL